MYGLNNLLREWSLAKQQIVLLGLRFKKSNLLAAYFLISKFKGITDDLGDKFSVLSNFGFCTDIPELLIKGEKLH